MGALYLPLIDCEIELGLSCSKSWIITETLSTTVIAANPPNPTKSATSTTGATFQIDIIRLYVLVVALSINDNIKFLKHFKQGLTRTVSWNKYRSEIKTQPRRNNLDYIIDLILIGCFFFH